MTRRDDHLDAMVRHLGAAYYQALHGTASAADVTKAVAQVTEAAGVADQGSLLAAEGAQTGTRRTGQWRVSDVMTTKVVSVTKDTSYKQIAQLLHEHHLTALPVLTPEGQVAGVVSEADLLRKQERHERSRHRPDWQLHQAVRAKTQARNAAGLMTAPAVTIGPDAVLGTAARLMSAHRIKRLPVVEADGKLAGIVSRADLLRGFLRSDAEIAAEASAVLTDILLADSAAIRVTAHDGVITLAGRLASQEQVAAAARLAEAVDGVVAVTNELHAPPPENWPGAGYHIPA
jgi:CBS-domain-containing membrane protein